MKDLTKAQITIGLLAFFATVWVVALNLDYSDLLNAVLVLLIQFVSIMILSYVILAILEWTDVFDLNTNALLTLIVDLTVLSVLIFKVLSLY